MRWAGAKIDPRDADWGVGVAGLRLLRGVQLAPPCDFFGVVVFVVAVLLLLVLQILAGAAPKLFTPTLRAGMDSRWGTPMEDLCNFGCTLRTGRDCRMMLLLGPAAGASFRKRAFSALFAFE